MKKNLKSLRRFNFFFFFTLDTTTDPIYAYFMLLLIICGIPTLCPLDAYIF